MRFRTESCSHHFNSFRMKIYFFSYFKSANHFQPRNTKNKCLDYNSWGNAFWQLNMLFSCSNLYQQLVICPYLRGFVYFFVVSLLLNICDPCFDHVIRFHATLPDILHGYRFNILQELTSWNPVDRPCIKHLFCFTTQRGKVNFPVFCNSYGVSFTWRAFEK